ncbi:restriction endonuclease subunit S [Virgibacillus dakarensis]|uniref:restriction endonuclease subunit S n=1 Tax=Virgibacillus dakarensis TaxID=1917889 RepID=UPI000B44FB05|nr:restriction endonuclease subunit S [Virgibacillus dakarensis]
MNYTKERKMKESGSKWVKYIPSHWKVVKGKYLFKLMNHSVREQDDIVTAFRDGQVTLRKNRRTDGFTNSIKESGYQGVRKGELVIHAMDAFAGAIGVSDSDGKCTPVYSICRPKYNVNPYYFSYLLREVARSGYLISIARGIRKRSTDFRFNEFANLRLLCPPIEEQNIIVSFLDEKVSKIESYINIKEKQIKLLEELKKTNINSLVLKGVYKNREFIDSGMDWLGKIPKDWEVSKLKAILKVKHVKNCPDKNLLSIYREYGVIPKDSRNDNHNVESDDLSSYKYVEKGNLVINKMKAWQGSLAISEYEGIISPAYIICNVSSDKVYNKYLHYLLRSKAYIRAYKRLSYGVRTGQWDMRFHDFKNLPLLLPEIKEQKEIVNKIEGVSASINNLIESYQVEIESIKEYKNTLISKVVTGNLNVSELNSKGSDIHGFLQ